MIQKNMSFVTSLVSKKGVNWTTQTQNLFETLLVSDRTAIKQDEDQRSILKRR